ncbi:type II toxin-antitoxin system HicA family toxin [Pseudoalteromonas sp. SWXJ133]|uniref:type II toxin-antitoxin system HicA family toxin n=1 Tax=Pseudoalteromonas sp. SWXJ133 TaxID=2792069 RepID=UPI0018CF34BD|nr:type II toxin-antitoxin system HicA family toxin [Pseudoalteromonas sp. SWXJ133]
MNSKDLIKEAGWQEVRVKGSHHHFRHPTHINLITVPHPKKGLGKGLVAKILKDAGL